MSQPPVSRPSRAQTQAPSRGSSPSPQGIPVELLRSSAPFARSFPGLLLLVLFLLGAAVLVMLKVVLRIFSIGLAAAVRYPPADRPSRQPAGAQVPHDPSLSSSGYVTIGVAGPPEQ